MTPRSFNVFRVSLLIRNFDSFPSFLASIPPSIIPPSGLAMISPLSHDGSGLDFLARLVGGASSDEIAYAQREIKKHTLEASMGHFLLMSLPVYIVELIIECTCFY